MLLGHKKTQENDQNWCIILNPLRNEMDKKKVAQKIAKVFSLSEEESLDLVANTPIILLDNLTRPIALKLKEYFRPTGADMVLSNDVFQKRKCYRTVWPETPSLSFLHEWGSNHTDADHEALPADEALHEIRSLSEELKSSDPDPEITSLPDVSGSERAQLLEEVERWRKESVTLRSECQRLKEEIQKIRQSRVDGDFKDFQTPVEQKEREIKELRLLVANAEEKHEVLKEESRQVHHLYEEKLAFLIKENEDWKKKNHELTDFLARLQKEKQNLMELLNQKDEKLRRLGEDSEKSGRELEALRLKAREAVEKIELLQKNKETLDQAVNENAEQAGIWRQKHDALLRRLEALERTYQEEKSLKEKFETQAKDFEKSHARFFQDLESRSAEVRQWELKNLDMERQLAQLRQSCENHEKALEENLRQMESRERELETARRQLREMNFQIEQREAVVRRTQLANQLVEKETVFKKLIKEQEKIEMEIREREEAIRKILTEQESVEKEIIEGKQAQRHLLEQAKRDSKPSRIRIAKNGPGSGAPADPSSEISEDENDDDRTRS